MLGQEAPLKVNLTQTGGRGSGARVGGGGRGVLWAELSLAKLALCATTTRGQIPVH